MKLLQLTTLIATILFALSCSNETEKNNTKLVAEPYQLQQTIYYGGDIITMEGNEPEYVEAVVQREGKIVFVGSKDEAFKRFEGKAKEVDLNGKTLMPGFIDGHGHLYLTGYYNLMANLMSQPDGNVKNIQGVVEELNRWKETEEGKFFVNKFGWIVGFGYDDSQLEEKEHPTAADLDKVSTEVPVVIIHQSGHLGAVNHKALEVFGITKESKDPEGGHIRKDANGEPNGILEEIAFQNNEMKMLAKIDDEVNEKILTKGQEIYTLYGYTTAQEGGGNTVLNSYMEKAADSNVFYIDLVTYPVMYMGLETMDSKYNTKDHSYINKYRVGGVKLVFDGSPQGKTAWLSEPYYKPPLGQNHHYHGYPKLTHEDALKYTKQAFENQWQLLVHTNGDAALDELLNNVKEAQKDFGYEDHRTTVVHGQVMRKDQIPEIKALGMYASEYAVHTFYWGDWHLNSVLGSPRAEYISPCRDLIDAGINLTSHSDCPVIPPNALRIIDATANRVTRSGLVLGAEQKISVYESLLTQTRWAAKQYYEENSKGTLTEGKLADFVILEENPLKIDPLEIHNIKVDETIKEGKTVYKK